LHAGLVEVPDDPNWNLGAQLKFGLEVQEAEHVADERRDQFKKAVEEQDRAHEETRSSNLPLALDRLGQPNNGRVHPSESSHRPYAGLDRDAFEEFGGEWGDNEDVCMGDPSDQPHSLWYQPGQSDDKSEDESEDEDGSADEAEDDDVDRRENDIDSDADDHTPFFLPYLQDPFLMHQDFGSYTHENFLSHARFHAARNKEDEARVLEAAWKRAYVHASTVRRTEAIRKKRKKAEHADVFVLNRNSKKKDGLARSARFPDMEVDGNRVSTAEDSAKLSSSPSRSNSLRPRSHIFPCTQAPSVSSHLLMSMIPT
jgi:hypothetical protein